MAGFHHTSVTDVRDLPAAAATRASFDVERLAGYVSMETPSGDRPALDGFADRLCADLAMARASARTVPLPHGDLLVADLPGRGPAADQPPAVLLAHHDTVHPAGSLAGPVPLRRDGDLLYGPGVYDMKGGLVVALAALELLGRLPHRPVRLILTPDEEVGSPSSASTVLAEAAGAAYALGLEPPHPDGALTSGRMGSTRWRVETVGRAARAGFEGGAGVNAIDELVDQLASVRQIVARHPGALVNLGTITGGGDTDVVPGTAHADLGFRFADSDTEEQVLAALSELGAVRTGATVVSRALARRPAWEPSADTADLLSAVVVAGSRVGQQVDARPSSGAADTNLTGAASIASLDGFGPLGAGAHTPREHIDLTTLPGRVALLAAVLATV
ncbi:MAG: M20/M25/M40 family metallo-hydrolase [Micrococcales bacterium]|nr:M20/M25/M40 family metallo-hydrolase [Micrococcales bacterium]